jgi:NAD(P)-dependent dehydrogenase (short-subunit alcohol dehydrogenase family)
MFSLSLIRGVEEAAERLRATGAAVSTLQADLSTYDGTEGAAAAIQQGGRPVDILALNAGRAVGGPFLEADLQSDLALIDLNVESVVHMAKRLLPAMVARGEGRARDLAPTMMRGQPASDAVSLPRYSGAGICRQLSLRRCGRLTGETG